MFETSQQEPSGGHTKVVAGVILVLMVVLGIAYYFYIHSAPPAQQTAQAGVDAAGGPAAAAEDANPVRDLSILRYNLGRDRTQTMAIWDLQLSNRSRTHTYSNIQYATNYYDGQDNLIYHNEGTIQEQFEPGDQRSVSQINDGLYPVGAARYTIEIKGAEVVQP
ncbi:MAG: hypothetical protein HY647_06470 [Acidobacteria bacterium]|nr:hypothetical protein [Acidobacteriota bacterium]